MFHVCAGLDLSLRNAGVAIIVSPLEAVYKTFGYGIDAKSTERDKIDRVIHIANGIMGLLREYKVRHVGVENYGFASKGKLAMQGELSGVVKTQVLMMGRMPIVLGANTIRKYILGKATKDKKAILNHMVGLGYPRPGNLDESDALAIAHLVSDWGNLRDRQADEYRIGVFETIDYNVKRTV